MLDYRCTVAGCLLAFTSTALGDVFTYDSVNGLPDPAQWTLTTDAGAPSPAVVDGLLSFNTTPYTRFARQFYSATLTEGSLIDQDWSFEVEAKILSSPQGNGSGFWRSGFSFGITDESGQFISLEIGDSSVSLRNANNGGVQTTGLNLSDNFHVFRLEVIGGQATGFLDGSNLGWLPVQFNNDATPLSAGFGDRTNIFNGSSLVRRAKLEVPEPAGLVSLGLAGLALVRRR
ncbi:MAG: hypothetical protein RLN76_01530 [Phycisphaeraceae bacterium]